MLLQLKDRLGRSWRNVARHLNIRECEIDDVENRYPSLKEQCYQVRLYTYIITYFKIKVIFVLDVATLYITIRHRAMGDKFNTCFGKRKTQRS